MAARKKTTKRSSKKASRKRPARPKKAAPVALTTSDRARKLKPRTNYREIVETTLRIWEESPGVRLTGVTRAQLRRALGAALKAADKEDALRRQLEPRLRGAADARLIAEDALWRKLLDVNALLRAQSRVDPRIAESFAFLTDALRSEREPDVDPTPATG